MPRPFRRRRVEFNPSNVFFKPAGIRQIELELVILKVEEFEAIRLKDLEGMGQKECAIKMDISQPTFHRLLAQGRKKIADAIVNKKAIKVEGGDYVL